MERGYVIELFDKKQHDIKNFRCGIEVLDKYLKERAGQEIKKKITAVYVLRVKNSGRVIGFYTLSSFSIELTNLPQEITKKLPKYKTLPVILLGRLAVDKKSRGTRIGEKLLLDAVTRSYKLIKKFL